METEGIENATVSDSYTTMEGIHINSTISSLIEQFKRNWNVKQSTEGFFSEDYAADINGHWLKFEPPDASNFIILGLLYIVIMIVGVFGNGLVVLLFCRCKSLRSPANKLIINLAISDALMLLKMPIFIYNCFYKGPVLGDIACRIYGFIGGLSGTSSIGTLAAISFDRYFVIKFPLKRFSSTRIYTCLVCSWINALSFSLIPLLNIGFGKYQYEGYLISCSFDYLTDNPAIKTFILVFCFAAFVAPMCIIAFSYIKIMQVVCGRSAALPGKRDSIRHVKEQDKRKQEIKLAIIVLTVICLWFFSWSPYAVVALLGIFGQKHLITPSVSMIPALFCKTTSAIDPYVYAISHPKFREELWKLLGIIKKKQQINNRRVWSTKSQLETTDYYDDGVEEEFIEIELKPMRFNDYYCKQGEFKKKERELKRQISKASLLCLYPTFSNKESSFRRLSRRYLSERGSQKKQESSQ